MTWGGMIVGAAVLAVSGLTGLAPLAVSSTDVTLLNHQVSWLVPVLGLSVLAAAFAYVTGIAAARRLGAKLGSFVALAEVLFARRSPGCCCTRCRPRCSSSAARSS